MPWDPKDLLGTVDRHSIKCQLPLLTPDQIANLAEVSRNLPPGTKPSEHAKSLTRSLQRRLSPTDTKELASRYEAGESVSELSRAYGISRPGIRKILNAQGVSLRERGMTQEDADRAIGLYKCGLTIMEIVDEVGYSYGVVNRMLHKREVTVRPRRHQG